jgi:alkylation response protein AidB-like acyl-CoA dehydrogenase
MAIEFEFSDEHRLFRRTLRGFLEEEIRPMLDDSFYETEEFPWEPVQEMADQGLFGVPVPPEYGGAGLGEIGYGILLEEVSKVDTGLATIVGAHTGICLAPIHLFGTEAQKERYLPPLCRGEKIGAFALTEPQAGSDAANIRTRAEREGDEYVLDGTKIYVSNGDVADTIMVSAVTDPALGAKGGVTAFLVDTDTEGFHVSSKEDKMGIRRSTTAQLEFDDLRVPADNVLGNVGEGFIVALTALDGGRATLGAGSLGGAAHALNTALDYTKTREQFDEPLAHKQDVQFRLAEMATDIDSARYSVYHCLEDVERYYEKVAAGEDVDKQFREHVSRRSAQVKIKATEIAAEVTETAADLMGARGLHEAWGIEKGLRDAPIAEIYEGTNEIQRLVIGRDLVQRGEFQP